MKKLSFYDWLCEQKKRDDIIGDLAYDAIRDKERPETSNIKDWRIHLSFGCDGAKEALEEAFKEYREYKKT
jgi:hypothetical protein